MTAVLLRTARLDALDVDAQAQPPDRQLAEVEERVGAGEGNAIVGPDGAGQAELLENALEHGEGIGFLGGRQRLAGNQIAAGEVSDRQRIAIAPIGEHELALIVGTPQIIGSTAVGKWCPRRLVAPSLAVLDHAVPVEHRMHSADRRPVHIWVEPGQSLAYLRRTPSRLVLLQAHKRSLDAPGRSASQRLWTLQGAFRHRVRGRAIAARVVLMLVGRIRPLSHGSSVNQQQPSKLAERPEWN